MPNQCPGVLARQARIGRRQAGSGASANNSRVTSQPKPRPTPASARPTIKEQRRDRAQAKQAKQAKRDERARAGAADNAHISAIHFAAPARAGAPRVIAHLGPTNSGKTHEALEALVAHGRGVYASPLRMLAQEVHARLAARLGDDAVGLVTGEERINERARIIACTVELAPADADVLVIDEVHWAADTERGQAWTRLFLDATGHELHLVGAGGVESNFAPICQKHTQGVCPDLKIDRETRPGHA